MCASGIRGQNAISQSEPTQPATAATLLRMAKTPQQLISASDFKRRVGESLILARESLGQAQAPFARTYGLAPNKLNQWEAGLYYPDPQFLIRLCADWGFTMDWFYRRVLAGVSVERADGLRQVASENSPEHQG